MFLVYDELLKSGVFLVFDELSKLGVFPVDECSKSGVFPVYDWLLGVFSVCDELSKSGVFPVYDELPIWGWADWCQVKHYKSSISAGRLSKHQQLVHSPTFTLTPRIKWMIFKDRMLYIYCMLYYMLHGSLYLMACGFLLGVSIQTSGHRWS